MSLNWSSAGVDWGNDPSVNLQWLVTVTGTNSATATGSCVNATIITSVNGPPNSCTFTPSIGGGTYTVTLTPKNSVGTAASGWTSSPFTVTGPTGPTPPSGTPSVYVSQPGLEAVLRVSWLTQGVSWGTGSNPRWKVVITGGSFDASTSTCSAAVSSTAISCTFTALTDGAMYTATVTPVTDNGSGGTGTATGTASIPAPAPDAPTNVRGTPGDNSITVSWDAPTTGGPVQGYNVWASAAELIEDVYCPEEPMTTGTTCTISGLPAGLAYTLHVGAMGMEGIDQWGGVATGTPSGPPSGRVKSPAEVPAWLIPVAQENATKNGKVTISGSGYKPGSLVVLTVHSTPVEVGTATVLSDGTFSATVTLPADLPLGNHTLLAAGLGTDGMVKYMSKALAVSAPSASALPKTGGNVTRIVFGALALLVIGAAAVAVTDGRIVRRLRQRTGVTG